MRNKIFICSSWLGQFPSMAHQLASRWQLPQNFYAIKTYYQRDDVSPEVVQELRFVLVESMDEVINVALHVHTLSPAIEEAIPAKPMERRKQKKT